MRIAIHHYKGGFSERWISYCKKHNIDYKLVDCHKNDIINQLQDCDALMWHHTQSSFADFQLAKQLLFSLQQTGKKVFPDFNTSWHFDDKVGQKYLLEAIGAPLVPTYVFYSKSEALDWIKGANFPKVFKLRGGSGSANVRLVKSAFYARKLVRKAFHNGYSSFSRIENLKERVRIYKEDKGTLLNIIKGIGRLIIPINSTKMLPNQKGYIYFQDYIISEGFDIRVIVIAEKAFAIKRIVRKNDFRASGSGNILYEKSHFKLGIIELSFLLSKKLNSQCVAFDFIYDLQGNPYVIEINYGFAMLGYDSCVGYWDKTLHFHEGPFTPQDWMVDLLLKENK